MSMAWATPTAGTHPPSTPSSGAEREKGVGVGRLEDPDSEETRGWVEAQNKVTFGLLEGCSDRPKLRERLTEVYNYPKYSCPFKRGGRFYFFKNDGLQNQPVLYAQDSLHSSPTVCAPPPGSSRSNNNNNNRCSWTSTS